MPASAQPGAPASSANSDDGNQPGAGASKNRACPFCGQLFTSSSLGRHLDLYIKDKNPKAPDGVHDVDQIRKLRSQITRRHARNSTGPGRKGERDGERDRSVASPGDSASASKQSPLVEGPAQAPSLAPPQFTQSGFPHAAAPAQNGMQDFHRLKWQATGVINDIPPRTVDSPRIDIFRDPEQRQKLVEERDQGRAAELALRELLAQIQAAHARLQSATLFPDFDFFACNFPSLCFNLLPPPPTLFSTTPLDDDRHWPVKGPPSQSTYEAVKDALTAKVDQYHHQHSSPGSEHSTQSSSVMSRDETRRYLHHLNATWLNWSALAETQRSENWHLELLRVAADERRRRVASVASLEQVNAELDNLRLQLHEQATAVATDSNRPGSERNLWRQVQRTSGHSPLGSISSAPSPYVPSSVVTELSRASDGLHPVAESASRWDFDVLVSRWRDILRNGPRPSFLPPPPSVVPATPVPASAGAGTEVNGGLTPGGGSAANAGSTSNNNHRDSGTSRSGDSSAPANSHKRRLTDSGASDQQLQSRPAPALRAHNSSNGSSSASGKQSPTRREKG